MPRPVVVLIAVLLTAPASQAETLDDLSRALAAAPAWTASFVQRYLPAGFDDGTSDSGRVVVQHPGRLRFDYENDEPRAFAYDGLVARMVDLGAGTCDAVRLDPAARDGLPLNVLIDPARRGESFVEDREGTVVVLTPLRPTTDVSQLRIEVGASGLPDTFTVVDGAGNRNEFTFTDWRRAEAPAPGFFTPALPGIAPCQPIGG